MTIVRCYMVISFAFKVDKCVFMMLHVTVLLHEMKYIWYLPRIFFFLDYTDNGKYRKYNLTFSLVITCSI